MQKGDDEESGTPLPDVNPDFTPQQTLDYYIVYYPELTTATIQGPEVLKDSVRYTFCPQLGTKG